MTTMVSQLASFGAVGIDCLEPLTLGMLIEISQLMLPGTRTGISWIGRYLENLTAEELENAFSCNLSVLLIGESPANGYIPTSQDGTTNGGREVARAQALSIKGIQVGIVCDLEGMGGTSDETIAYANAYGNAVMSAGFQCIAYVGAGVPLTPEQLYELDETLYWHSMSSVQEVAVVDYAFLQAYPTQTLNLGSAGTLEADVNFVYRDKRGRAPYLLAAA
jgi:hypothetical protein